MQTLIIGDIHGCLFELQALLDRAGLTTGDSIIALGDIVDRGPETPQVVDFFRQTNQAYTIMGNHEKKHFGASKHLVKLSISQLISRQQFGNTYPDAVAWMGTLPLFIELPEAIILHGYLEPDLPLAQQRPTVLCGTMGGDKILRERYTRPWYELYNGEKPVIVGHNNYTHSDQPFVYQHKVFGLDTDCVHGKALTGLLLPDLRFIAVPSRGNLWHQVRRTYQSPGSAVQKTLIAWSEKENQALEELLEKVRSTHQALLARLQAEPGYAELTARQQARLYSSKLKAGLFSTLMQLCRVGKLDLETARKIVKDPAILSKMLSS